MDKKPLIGVSICAMILLVLGSLTNVVGYQSVKSTVNDSPLFQTRTQRATNQQQNSITSQYLGMGKGILFQFPMRDNRTESLIKAIEYIGKMDDETYERFTERCIQRIQQDKSLKDANSTNIMKALILIKTKPTLIIYSLMNRNNQKITSGIVISICDHWFPGCILIDILTFMWITFILIWDTVWAGETLCRVTCAAECFKANEIKDFIYL
jgi:hypothetical protein